MIILLFIILTLLMIGFIILAKLSDKIWRIGCMAFHICGAVITGFMLLFVVGCLIGCIDSVISGRYIDEKIAMYEEENERIETQISALVENYMDYESSTLIEFKGDDAVILVSLYPELKSDALVQQQITIYAKNNMKIKELREQKIDVKTAKWWLYFGG